MAIAQRRLHVAHAPVHAARDHEPVAGWHGSRRRCSATGHHFARPGNRFWPALHEGGFTPRLFAPWEERELLPLGYGITNVVPRTTPVASELRAEEYVEGGERLAAKVSHYRPRWLAVLGIGAYRTAFGDAEARLGAQARTIGHTRVWVLPNPSGLNAHYDRAALARLFAELREAAGEAP